jgi:predicted nucleic acid-binding protein
VKVLCDTSVLVAALVATHPFHSLAFPWLKRAKAGDVELLVSTHSVAELYAVLTRLPVSPRISPPMAHQLVGEILDLVVETVALTSADYTRVVERMAELGLTGGAVYDALIVCAAQKSAVDRLLTFNEREFRRIWPEGDAIVAKPEAMPED